MTRDEIAISTSHKGITRVRHHKSRTVSFLEVSYKFHHHPVHNLPGMLDSEKPANEGAGGGGKAMEKRKENALGWIMFPSPLHRHHCILLRNFASPSESAKSTYCASYMQPQCVTACFGMCAI